MNRDESLMGLAIELAERGMGNVAPNPLVGALVVQHDKVVAHGYHEKFGEAHAEINAIDSLTDRSLLKGATLYVNLEPCNHSGKTPPCVATIIKSGIARVVIGCLDPNKSVAGGGARALRKGGTEVISGVLEEECRDLNRRFFCFHQKQRPYVILKWAETSDGFIARPDFSSRWISNESSRILAHTWRREEQAVLVGTNTALRDDPALTVRHVAGNNPIRLVIDRELKLPGTLKLFNSDAKTWVFSEKLIGTNCDRPLFQLNFAHNLPKQILDTLYKEDIISVMIEGGAKTVQSFIDAGLWDEARVFVAPKTFELGINAPKQKGELVSEEFIADDILRIYRNQEMAL